MLPWIGVLLGTGFAAASGYLAVRRSEGRTTARRRLPLLGLVSAVTAAALVLVAATSPAEWWNYLLIPGSTYEWYTALIWGRRRAEAGGVRVEFRHPPRHGSLLLLAAFAIFSGIMDLRAGGVSISNLLLFGLGASNVAVYVALARSRPGLVHGGILLFDRLVPWDSIQRWQLSGQGEPKLDILLKREQRADKLEQGFSLDPGTRDVAIVILRDGLGDENAEIVPPDVDKPHVRAT